MWCPDYDSTGYTDTWDRGSSAGNEVTYVNYPDPAPKVFNIRHVPMREQGIPEVPWREPIPLLPVLTREVDRFTGRQRGWTGRNFRRAA